MNKFARYFLFFLIWIATHGSFAQKSFTKYDYLHGKLTPLRTCFEIKHYDIHLKVDPATKFISGKNTMSFMVVKSFKKMQLDFSSEMQIDSIVCEGKRCKYERDSNATFVFLETSLQQNIIHKMAIYFSGHPHVAKKAPWDGGFVWSKDSMGNPWVGLACEGIGASIWLPCKDHWSDEADSMDMHLSVPETLVGVSNGQLLGTKSEEPGFVTSHWQVKNPINNYSISINVGDYVHLSDLYRARTTTTAHPLLCDYYVLRYHAKRASSHFTQVMTMLECYERYFGPYPFWKDGYKLVETPYWGMEHQSCVAYGNNFRNNKFGFDFIIIHESAHEWFANSITASDPADMWIHESFTTYAEALYVEYTKGYPAYILYLLDQKKNIKNAEPLVGVKDVYFHGRSDNDIYYKGSWMLHTMRSILDDDSTWFAALKGFCLQFEKQIITTKDVIAYFNKATQRNWSPFFEQYLYKIQIPTLEYKLEKNEDGNMLVRYKWLGTVSGFEMPIKATMTKDKWDVITPKKGWQLIDLNYFEESDFKVQTDHYLMEVKKLQK